MEKTSFLQNHKKLLLTTRTKQLGYLESLMMYLKGKADGKVGLPRKTDDGFWESPVLQKELAAYLKQTSLLWGQTQIELQNDYALVGEYIDTIRRLKKLIKEHELQAPQAIDESFYLTRKAAEGNLSDGQVRSRRAAEVTKNNATYHNRMNVLKGELESCYKQLITKHNNILEINQNIRLICEKLRFHLELRRKAYWNGVLRTHESRDQLPCLPAELPAFIDIVEEIYLGPHKTFSDDTLIIDNRLNLEQQYYKEIGDVL